MLVPAPESTGTISRADCGGSGDYGEVMADHATSDLHARRPARGGRRLGLVLVAALTATTLGTLALPGEVLGWSANTFNSSSERQLFSLTNQARASAGKRTLRWDATLASIARGRSKDMINRNYFSHSIPGAGNVFDQMSARGYCFKVAGENIGWNNYPDSAATAQIQQMFMGSPGHRENIVGSAWDVAGIGAYKGANGKMMWTVLFADKCGSVGTTTKPKPVAKPKPVVHSTPTPAPRATPKPAPAATPAPTPIVAVVPNPGVAADARAGADLAPLQVAVTGAGTSPDAGTATGGGTAAAVDVQSLRVADQASPPGFLESLFAGITGIFFGA